MRADYETPDSRREQRQIRDAYGLAFGLVFSSTLALVAAGAPISSPLAAAAGFLQAAALLVTLRVSGIESRWSLVGSVVVVALFSVLVMALLFGGVSTAMPGIAAWLLLTITTIAAIARRLVTYTEVTLQLVMGLLVIYVLIGMSFGLGYQFLESLNPPALNPEGQGVSGAVYYSFITLATVGYGDVSPASDATRALAIGEALVGQLYLVSVVSLAVSRLGSRKRAIVSEEHE